MMRSGRSFFNGAVFRSDFRRFWIFPTVLFIVSMLNDGINVYGKIVSGNSGSSDFLFEYASEGMFMFHMFLTFVCAIYMAAFAVFRYLGNPSACNFEHSMPVNRTELFVTHGLSGITMLLAPQLLSLLCVLKFLLGDKYERPFIPELFTAVIVVSVLFFGVACLAVMLTGISLAAPVVYLFMLLSGWMVSCAAFFTGKLFTFGFADDSTVFEKSFSLFADDAYSGDKSVLFGTLTLKPLLLYELLGLAAAAAAYFLYRARSLENAGSFCAFRWFRPFVRWSLTLAHAFVMTYILSIFVALTPVLFIAVFAFFALAAIILSQMLIEAKIRVFRPKLFIEWAVGCAVVFSLIFGLSAFNESRLPVAAEDVKNVQAGVAFNMYYDDPEHIEKIVDLEKYVLRNKKQLERYLNGTGYYSNPVITGDDEQICTLNIIYCFKDGSTEKRLYTIPVNDDTLSAEGCLGRLSELETDEAFLDYVMPCYSDDADVTGCRAEIWNEGNEDYVYYSVPSEGSRKLMDAFGLDVKEGNVKFKTVDLLRDAPVETEVIQPERSVFEIYYSVDPSVEERIRTVNDFWSPYILEIGGHLNTNADREFTVAGEKYPFSDFEAYAAVDMSIKSEYSHTWQAFDEITAGLRPEHY